MSKASDHSTIYTGKNFIKHNQE